MCYIHLNHHRAPLLQKFQNKAPIFAKVPTFFVLCYKSEGRWFDPSWCQFLIDIKSFRSHYGPGVDSASNRNEYQEYFMGVKAAGA